MSLDQILDKKFHIFEYLNIFRYFLCVLGIFWVEPGMIRTEPVCNRTKSESTNTNYPIESNYLRSNQTRIREDPNREFQITLSGLKLLDPKDPDPQRLRSEPDSRTRMPRSTVECITCVFLEDFYMYKVNIN